MNTILNRARVREYGGVLQKRGFTLSEIAEAIDVPRWYVVQILYWEEVGGKWA